MIAFHSSRHIPVPPSGNHRDVAPRHKPRQKQTKVREPTEPPETSRNNYKPTNPRVKRRFVQTARNANTKLSPVVKDGPITPREALGKYSHFLTSFEKCEITQFPEIYYVGIKSRKIEPNMSNMYSIGFDDNNHNYKVLPGDHLAYRFEVISSFGAGAFGKVLKCYDHKMRKRIAVKIIIATEQMHEQGHIEAKILAKLNKMKTNYIVKAYDFFIFRSHICITYEILGKNLFEISEMNLFRPLPLKDIKNYAYEILKGIEACHSVGVIHCDLKPENVLVHKDNQKHVKIIDFGSSCFVGHQKYEYIQSRFYRAPEVMLGIEYGPPMDIWSFALILAEIAIGKPLFPGDNEIEQLALISEVIGAPDPELVKKGKRRREFFDQNMILKVNKYTKDKKPKSITLQKALHTDNALFCDFIAKCLTWDQKDRITVTEALLHPWLTSTTKSIKHAKQSSNGLPILKY